MSWSDSCRPQPARQGSFKAGGVTGAAVRCRGAERRPILGAPYVWRGIRACVGDSRDTWAGSWTIHECTGRCAMPYGGNDWLELTQEEVLEPELPICDPHHHLWDKRTERIPYQRYLLSELLADVNQGHNVRSTVFVEARVMYRRSGPVELRPVGQVEFVQGQAAMAASGVYGPTLACAAIVGYADLKLGDRVEPVLEALQAASPNRFRGVRHSVMWDPHPDFDSREPEGTMSTDNYRAGAKVLARMGHSLDAQVCFTQLAELAEFARSVPDLTIVLNHLAGLWREGPFAGRDDEVLPAWKQGLAEVAACPNIYLKLGGIGMPRLASIGTPATGRSARKSWPGRWPRSS